MRKLDILMQARKINAEIVELSDRIGEMLNGEPDEDICCRELWDERRNCKKQMTRRAGRKNEAKWREMF